MSDYTNTFDGATKDSGTDPILGADHDVELDAIAVALATKADVVAGGVFDNLVSQAASGGIDDSDADSDHYLGLSGVIPTQLATKIVCLPEASNHKKIGNLQMADGDQSHKVSASDITESTWETVGPSGNGADHVIAFWPASPIPRIAVFNVIISTTNTGGVGTDTHTFLHTTHGDDASPALDSRTLQVRVGHTALDSSCKFGFSQLIFVPLNADGVFKMYWEGNGSGTQMDMYYKGFIG